MGCLLLADTINKSGIPAATAVVLHGDMAQEKRSEILREFLNNQHSVLVTTNVLGRGVDLMNVKQARREEMGKEVGVDLTNVKWKGEPDKCQTGKGGGVDLMNSKWGGGLHNKWESDIGLGCKHDNLQS